MGKSTIYEAMANGSAYEPKQIDRHFDWTVVVAVACGFVAFVVLASIHLHIMSWLVN